MYPIRVIALLIGSNILLEQWSSGEVMTKCFVISYKLEATLAQNYEFRPLLLFKPMGNILV